MAFQATNHPENNYPARYFFDLMMRVDPSEHCISVQDTNMKHLSADQRVAVSKTICTIEKFLSQDNAIEQYQSSQLQAFSNLLEEAQGDTTTQTTGWDLYNVIFGVSYRPVAGKLDRFCSWAGSGGETSEDLAARTNAVFMKIASFRKRIVHTPPKGSHWETSVVSLPRFKENYQQFQTLLKEFNQKLETFNALTAADKRAGLNPDQNPQIQSLQRELDELDRQILPIRILHGQFLKWEYSGEQEREAQSVALTGRSFTEHQ